MTTERGKITRVLNLIRKHGISLLDRVRERYHHDLATQGVRGQITALTKGLDGDIEDTLMELLEEDRRIYQWTELIEKNNARDKLICTVFNDLSKQAQTVVMQGPEAQIRYFASKYGIDKAKKLVEAMIGSNCY